MLEMSFYTENMILKLLITILFNLTFIFYSTLLYQYDSCIISNRQNNYYDSYYKKVDLLVDIL